MVSIAGNASNGIKKELPRRQKHALVMPIATYSHTTPMFNFSRQLARVGVTVSFLTPSDQLLRIKSLVEQEVDLDFNVVSYDFVLERSGGTMQDLRDLAQLQRVHFRPLLHDLEANRAAGLPGPTCIIFDFFLPWVTDVGQKLDVPVYMFYCGGVSLTRLYQEVPGLHLKSEPSSAIQPFEEPLGLPGLPPLLYHDLPVTMLPKSSISYTCALLMPSVEAVIANTFYELEPQAADAIRHHFLEHTKPTNGRSPKLFTVGPFLSAGGNLAFAQALRSGGEGALQWLDERAPQSVLYICRGSVVAWTASHIHELAVALEASGHSFLWVLKPQLTMPFPKEHLPAGFEERTRGRGLIVSGWVPQKKILSHAATRGFLSHCGWNSCLESVAAGVPVIAWPQAAEQHLNSRHFVVTLGIAVQIGHGKEQTGPIPHEEIEEALRTLMDRGEEFRRRIQEMKLHLKAAVAEGGSSHRGLLEIAESIPGGGNK